ncbi:aldose 1-epimerase family protein [Limosilactobacillus equigenerosi]|nr:aldose 1-epimerase family protein [Limosilactobacillus equigenerosi]
MTKINLRPDMFHEHEFTLLENDDFQVTTFKYPSGIEAATIRNSRGYLTVLPFYGLIVWDAVFDGISLKMKDAFTQPLPGKEIADTYGCFQFNSGLLANGNPAPEDTHQQHGEFPTSRMDRAFLTVTDHNLAVHAEHEYVKGFGDHYLAQPRVTMHADSGLFDLEMQVTNLSNSQAMPLQYMCHMNYAYQDQAQISSNIPDEAFTLRQTIPAHVHPNEDWLAFNDELKQSGRLINCLDDAKHYDPEIVFFSSDLTKYAAEAEFKMTAGEGKHFVTKFKTADFPIVTRWLMYNGDQQVAAFALPGTSTPEGRLAAQKAGTLIMLPPHATKHFHVTTGLVKD